MKFLIVFSLQFAFSYAMFNSATVENQPYYAYVTFSNVQMSFYGGGAIISSTHILTCAANIQSFTAWRVGIGSNRRTFHQILITNRAVAHPNYFEDQNVRLNDIGIIFLNQPVALSPAVFPIFLPPIAAEKNHPMQNIQGMMLGFAGSASAGLEGLENLQGAHVRTMSTADCLQLYPHADATQHFCANDLEMGSNFCLGDQGGAFTIMLRGQEVLVGISSLPGCVQRPSTYTRIGNFRQWILSEAGV